jgi:hypothetical protein
MDFRMYDNAIGRFLGIDKLAEFSYSITPYRFAYNNPVYWSDPTGLFETRKEAREYRKEHSISGSIKKGTDGNFFINDKKNGLVYEKGDDSMHNDFDNNSNDGVVVGAGVPKTVSNSSNSSSLIKEGFTFWGDNRFGDLGGYKNGDRTHSIKNSTIPKGFNKPSDARGKNGFWEWLMGSWSNKGEIVGRIETIDAIIKDGNTSTPPTITKQNVEPVKPAEYPNDTIFSVTRKIDSDNFRQDFVVGGKKADSIVKANPNSVKKVQHIIRINNN